MNKAEKKKSTIIIIAVLIVIALLAAIYYFFGPKGQEGVKNITVKVDHLEGEDTSFDMQTMHFTTATVSRVLWF